MQTGALATGLTHVMASWEAAGSYTYLAADPAFQTPWFGEQDQIAAAFEDIQGSGIGP